MPGQRLRCKTCRRKFTRAQGTRRLHCEDCRPPRARVEPVEVVPAGPGPIEEATAADLAAVGRQGTVAGAVALRLARDLDSGRFTAAQTASMAAQLMRAVEKALEGAPRPPDRLDELAARRREKAAGA